MKHVGLVGHLRWLLIAAMITVSSGVGAAADKNGFSGCYETHEKPSALLIAQCELRIADSINVERVTVTGGGKVTTVPLDQSTAALFLLDLSGATIERNDFARLKAVVRSVLDIDAGSVSVGIYGFANAITTIAPLGTAPGTMKLALEAVDRKPHGTNELLKSVNNVIPMLKAASERRRFLIILSDGRFDDTAYSVAEISSLLNSNHITVFAVAPGRGPSDLTDAQALRRLSEDTSGTFFTAVDSHQVEAIAKTLKHYILAGGTVSFPVSAEELTLRAELSNGQSLAYQFKSKLFEDSNSIDTPQAAVTPQVAPVQARRWYAIPVQHFRDWLGRSRFNTLIAAAGILVAILLVWLGVALAQRVRRHKTAVLNRSSSKLESQSISALRPILARLEFLDGPGSTELISGPATRIGRHKDNDIILANTSVHRHHAILKQETSGPFTIFDMNTANGVVVNGARVATAKLQDGDVVELGEVRMRFKVA